MYRRVPLWAVALVVLAIAGLTIAQGYQPNFLRNLVGPVTVTGDETITGTLAAATVRANVVDGGTVVAHVLSTDGDATAMHFVSTASAAEMGLAIPADTSISFNSPTNSKTINYGALQTPHIQVNDDFGTSGGLYGTTLLPYSGTTLNLGTAGVATANLGTSSSSGAITLASGAATLASSATANDLKLGGGSGLTLLGATPRKRLGWMTSTNAATDFTAAQFGTINIADATAVAGGGTCTPAADVTDDAFNMVKFPTDASGAGHACGRNTAFTVLKATLLPSFSAVVRTDPSAVTSQTVFIGMVASSLDQITTLAGANGVKGCWFRYDTGLSDTTWQACSSEGTTASCTDTTVSVVAATTYRLGINNTVSGTCDYYVNGVRKVNKTSNINTTNTALGWEATITARASSARALSVAKVIVEEN